MLRLNCDSYNQSELYNVVRLFFDTENSDIDIECFFCEQTPYVSINGECYFVELQFGHETKFNRQCKAALYRVLCNYTGKSFDWGALTGVRPTKIGYELAANGEDIVSGLTEYGVSEQKARVIDRVIANQKGFNRSLKKVDFYVHIPFCTSRCSYCSFVSLPVKRNEQLMEQYVRLLCKEITSGAELLDRLGYEVDSVYIGGGTPTALNDEELKAVLDAIPYRGIEFTVEAGRPDTITPQKLDIMERRGVTRISINPQSFKDETLKSIGRAHSAHDIIAAYQLAKGRFVINMDLIAGLDNETTDDFNYTLDRAIELRPQNITVHTLAEKNGSAIKQDGKARACGVSDMVELAYKRLIGVGYEPYYLYRQKNMLENLENIGYSLPGFICANNVTTMEEFYSVFACGAGAISKRLFEGGRIERHANLRDVKLYIEQFEDRLVKKTNFFM